MEEVVEMLLCRFAVLCFWLLGLLNNATSEPAIVVVRLFITVLAKNGYAIDALSRAAKFLVAGATTFAGETPAIAHNADGLSTATTLVSRFVTLVECPLRR